MSHEGDGLDHGAEQPLMDGLPNDLARRCLARASRQAHANMQVRSPMNKLIAISPFVWCRLALRSYGNHSFQSLFQVVW